MVHIGKSLIYGPYWKDLSDECMSFHAVKLITCNHVFPLPPNICIHNWCPVSEGHRLTVIAHTAPLASYLWQINMVLILHLTLKNKFNHHIFIFFFLSLKLCRFHPVHDNWISTPCCYISKFTPQKNGLCNEFCSKKKKWAKYFVKCWFML
jgi:hypothetical protein